MVRGLSCDCSSCVLFWSNAASYLHRFYWFKRCPHVQRNRVLNLAWMGLDGNLHRYHCEGQMEISMAPRCCAARSVLARDVDIQGARLRRTGPMPLVIWIDL